MREHRVRLHDSARAAPDAAGGRLCGADCAAPITHGVGAAWPIVNDSLIVALNESVMEKNRTFTDSEMGGPASKPTSIGW